MSAQRNPNSATGLRPTVPGADIGHSFRLSSPAAVNSPITVRVAGNRTTSSTILYLDGQPREFQDLGCSGTQSSRRVDSQTVEVLRKCASGEWVRLVRRLSAHPNELVLEVTEQQAGGRRFESRLVLEKQSGVASAQTK